MTPPSRRAGGFTLLELLIALAVVSVALALLVRLAADAQAWARARPEAADQLQRLRVALSMLQRDLLRAGTGVRQGPDAGPLADYFAPILPRRTGAWSPDPELSFADDRITLIAVPEDGMAAPLTAAMPAPGADVMIDGAAPGCPPGGACGFTAGRRAAVVDVSGLGLGHDLFSVQAVAPGLSHGPPDPIFGRLHDTGSRVMPIEQRVYYFDRAGRRLMVYDGFQSDLPLVDEVVALQFSYWLDPSPGSVRTPAPGGASCAYAAGSPPRPLLADLAAASPVPAGASILTDGPVCGLAPNRFDADLLRIRRVRVRLRVQVADPGLRGRGALFAVPGTSVAMGRSVPDVEVTLDVAPRNLWSRP